MGTKNDEVWAAAKDGFAYHAQHPTGRLSVRPEKFPSKGHFIRVPLSDGTTMWGFDLPADQQMCARLHAELAGA